MIDLTTPTAVHVLGVGGAGMSAIATVLARMGHRVSGSDLKPSANIARLEALGVTVAIGHDAANLPPDVDAVAVSTAVPRTNPEVAAALDRGVPVLRRAEVLAAICATRRTIAVSGTHGKTTTSSMLALVLVEAGLRPSFIVGGEVNEIGSGAAWDDVGEWLVVEADESDGTFVELGAEAVVVTNVEPDHLAHYGGFAGLVAAFERFLADAPGPRIVCADDPLARKLGDAVGATTYGTDEASDYRLEVEGRGRLGSTITVHVGSEALGAVELPVPGLHNARNAGAALVTGLLVGAPFDAAARALGRFGGVARRFQFRGERDGVTFVDDYAHLPTEIASVIAAARGSGDSWKRVIAVFQPNRFNRMAVMSPDYADAFVGADVVVLTEIYASGTTPIPGVTGRLVVDAVLANDPDARVVWLPHREDIVSFLAGEVGEGDVCISMGCGDIATLPEEVMARRAARRSE